MKKILSLLCVVMTTALLITGCATKTEKITTLSDLEGKVVATLVATQDANSVRTVFEGLASVKLKEVMFYDTISAAVAALKSGHVDAVIYPELTMNFYASRDESLTTLPPLALPGETTCHMAMRSSDTELLAQINAALSTMRDDGTLAALEENFLVDLSADAQLEGKELPYFEGSPTLRVGISGDAPPLDYVAADGKPAGYNVELLSLLGEMLNMNVEISVLPMESKLPSLSSDKIDLFFFHVSNTDLATMNRTLEASNKALLTEAYYTLTSFGVLVLK